MTTNGPLLGIVGLDSMGGIYGDIATDLSGVDNRSLPTIASFRRSIPSDGTVMTRPSQVTAEW